MQFSQIKAFRSVIAILTAAVLLFAVAPATYAQPELQYDRRDVEIMQEFLRQTDGSRTNAEILGWDIDDVETWEGVEWDNGDEGGTILYLEHIDIQLAGITKIEFSGFQHLRTIFICNTDAVEIKLSDLPNLYWLGCIYNRLTKLDMTGLPSLKWLYCSDNLLTSLSLADFPYLYTVDCSNNRLTKVDIENCERLYEICAHGNPLDSEWADGALDFLVENYYDNEGSFTYSRDGLNYNVVRYRSSNSRSERTFSAAVEEGIVNISYYPISYSEDELDIYTTATSYMRWISPMFAGWIDIEGMDVYGKINFDDIIYIVVPKSDTMSIRAVLNTWEDETEVSEWHSKCLESLRRATGRLYAPEKPITRMEYLTILTEPLYEISYDVIISIYDSESLFRDIPHSAYGHDVAEIAKSKGITSGVGNNKFAPSALITRQDLYTMTYKALRAADMLRDETESVPVRFIDWEDTAGYARKAVQYFVNLGLIDNDGYLYPTGSVPMEEAFSLIEKLYELNNQ